MATKIDKYFIISGNHAEYRTWVNKNHIFYLDNNLHDFIFVHSSIVFRGYANPHGSFIGTFRSRADLHDIVQTIIMCSHDMSNQYKTELINRILPPARPTP